MAWKAKKLRLLVVRTAHYYTSDTMTHIYEALDPHGTYSTSFSDMERKPNSCSAKKFVVPTGEMRCLQHVPSTGYGFYVTAEPSTPSKISKNVFMCTAAITRNAATGPLSRLDYDATVRKPCIYRRLHQEKTTYKREASRAMTAEPNCTKILYTAVPVATSEVAKDSG